jgi:hypothetical protein
VDQPLSAPTDANPDLVWLQILTHSRQDSCKSHFRDEAAQGEAHSNGSDTSIRLDEGSDGSACPIGSEGEWHVTGQRPIDHAEEVLKQDVGAANR